MFHILILSDFDNVIGSDDHKIEGILQNRKNAKHIFQVILRLRNTFLVTSVSNCIEDWLFLLQDSQGLISFFNNVVELLYAEVECF